ncbi:MAG: hypothetical protein K8R13_01125 [Methanococcoides sp.]|nr:hypothetical protein [Methanococcoides sp.]
MEKETIFRNRISIGTLILLLGIILEVFTSIDSIITISLINAGIIVILVSYYKFIKYKGGHTQDEWTRKIGRTGLAYSWIVTFVVTIGLFWVDYFGWLQMSVNEVLVIIFFTMIISVNLFQFYFKRQGDVE